MVFLLASSYRVESFPGPYGGCMRGLLFGWFRCYWRTASIEMPRDKLLVGALVGRAALAGAL
eukprot:scaffold211507_cov42-Prasinocladus_malaysianus.AAC.1